MIHVPQSRYTREYYLHNCDGYTEDGSLCRRLQTLLSHRGEGGEGLEVADIGCGRGEAAKYLTENGYHVFSVDYSYAAVPLFEKNCGDGLPFLRHDVSLGMPWLKDGFFDLVILADIIEHLYPEQLRVLAADVLRILKKGGSCLIDTPIMEGGESELHVDIKNSAQAVMSFFPGFKLIATHWYKKPEHCNLILVKS